MGTGTVVGMAATLLATAVAMEETNRRLHLQTTQSRMTFVAASLQPLLLLRFLLLLLFYRLLNEFHQ